MEEEPETVLKKFEKSDQELVSDILDKKIFEGFFNVKGEEDEQSLKRTPKICRFQGT